MKKQLLLGVFIIVLLSCVGCKSEETIENSINTIFINQTVISQAEKLTTSYSVQKDKEKCIEEDELEDSAEDETIVDDIPKSDDDVTTPEEEETDITEETMVVECDPIPIPELKVEEPKQEVAPTPQPSTPAEQPPVQNVTSSWNEYEIPRDWGNSTDNIVMRSDAEARAWQELYPNGWLRTEDDMLLFTPAGKPAPPPEEIVYVSDTYGYKVGDIYVGMDSDGNEMVLTYEEKMCGRMKPEMQNIMELKATTDA